MYTSLVRETLLSATDCGGSMIFRLGRTSPFLPPSLTLLPLPLVRGFEKQVLS